MGIGRAASVVVVLFGTFFGANSAAAQNSGEDMVKRMSTEAQACAAVCLQEMDLHLFGGAIVVPFDRPSVEQCGIWISTPKEARAQQIAEQRKETDKVANQNHYSQRERLELHKKGAQQRIGCEATFRKHCDTARSTIPLARRKAAVAEAKKAIDDLAFEDRRATIGNYLKIVLEQCPLDQ